MIIKEFQLNKIISANNNFLCLLIYGPNEGLIREHINKIVKYYSSEQEYELLRLSGKELDEDNYSIDSYLKTVSMFYKGKMSLLSQLMEIQ